VGGRERAVVEQTWEELQQLDVGQWKGAEWQGTPIPLLADVIATVPAGKRLFIEIKCGPQVAAPLREVIAASGKSPDQLAIISFNDAALAASKQALPNIEHYLLARYKEDPETGAFPQLEPLIERAAEAGYEGLDLDYRWPIDTAFVAKIHDAGLA
jgi:glycerophosphoryl diester phosphodiesterase